MVGRRLGRQERQCDAAAAVRQLQLRPGLGSVSAPILTADWEADSGDKWTVPIGLGAGKLFRLRQLLGDGIGDLGKLPINTSLQGYWNAVTPDFGTDWQLRFQVEFLFPR